MQGVTYDQELFISHHSLKKVVTTSKECGKIHLGDATCIGYNIAFCVYIHSIFGIVVAMRQMSTKDRLKRKKYIGVWRWESELTARMMSRFSNTVIRYMERKSPNMRG